MNDTRKLIIEVSLDLFLQKTFKEVTLKELVERTGLSKGAFYHYFGSKEEILEEALKHYVTMRLAVNWDAYDYSSLGAFLECHVAALEKMISANESLLDRNFFSLMFDGIRLFPEFRETLKTVQNQETAAWVRAIHNSREAGELNTDCTDEDIANMFTSISDGLLISQLLYADKDVSFPSRLQNLWNGLLHQVVKS